MGIRVPKSTLRFDNLLEGFTELRKVVIVSLTVYYREIIHIKISKGKKERKGGFRKQVSRSLPGESHGQSLILPTMVDDNVYKLLPTREAQQSLGIQGFY